MSASKTEDVGSNPARCAKKSLWTQAAVHKRITGHEVWMGYYTAICQECHIHQNQKWGPGWFVWISGNDELRGNVYDNLEVLAGGAK